jgi:uncharacterized damage-inducible protein DinB
MYMNHSHSLVALWEEGRTRFSRLLEQIKEEDLKKTLAPAPNSVGFLIRHIADVELLFAKNVFKATDVEVHARTVIAQKDSGEWTNLSELLSYQQLSYNTLKKILSQQTDDDWMSTVTTKEFGTKTKAEALGRIVTHTTWHAGQMAIILKYGN